MNKAIFVTGQEVFLCQGCASSKSLLQKRKQNKPVLCMWNLEQFTMAKMLQCSYIMAGHGNTLFSRFAIFSGSSCELLTSKCQAHEVLTW